MPSRREYLYLLTVGTAGTLGGCSVSEAGDNPNQQTYSVNRISTGTPTDSSNYTFNETSDDALNLGWGVVAEDGEFGSGGNFRLKPGERAFVKYSRPYDFSLTYSYEITSGNRAEFFIISQDELTSFKNRSGPEIYFQACLEGEGSGSTEVTIHEFIVILDNTQFGCVGSANTASVGWLQMKGKSL